MVWLWAAGGHTYSAHVAGIRSLETRRFKLQSYIIHLVIFKRFSDSLYECG